MFRVIGGNRLKGELTVDGAKNAVLPILAATVLTDGPVRIENCPRLTDVEDMLSILKTLGCRADMENGAATVDASGADRHEMPDALSKKIRSSIFMLGPLIGRFRQAKVTYPGGCEIGQRPIDLHLRGLRALGVKIRERHGVILCDGSSLGGGEVYLDFPSVGATENVMMAAVLAKGRSTIFNAACEPEIRDLANFLNSIGAKVYGAGTGKISIVGVDALSGGTYRPIGDRIVAGTMLAAAAATRGEVRLTGILPDDLGVVLEKLRGMGCSIETAGDRIALEAPEKLRPFEISTQPFPGFPTDMQAQFMALAATVDGASVIVENVFENRFGIVPELRRMGTDVFLNDRTAMVRGGRLTGGRLRACDLRGGAALVVAALAAAGASEIENTCYIDRGYDSMENMLRTLGADMERRNDR